MKVIDAIEILKNMPPDATLGVDNDYLFPADITAIKYENIEGEDIVKIIAE